MDEKFSEEITAAAFPQIVRQRGGTLIGGSTAETLPKLVDCIKEEIKKR